MTYGGEPLNQTAVMQAIQSPTLRGYLVDKSVPWDAVDLPLVTSLPHNPKDRTEVNYLIDATNNVVVRMLWRHATGTWTQVGKPPSVTTLPTGAEGMEVYYTADATNGVVWHLRYYAAETTYKWRYLGGPPLSNEVVTAGTRTANTYAGLNTGGAGPTITLPLAGDYDVTIGASMYQTIGGIGYYSYDIGGTGAVDADALITASLATSVDQQRDRRKTIAAASTVLLAKYKATSDTLNIGNRTMAATPVRVI